MEKYRNILIVFLIIKLVIYFIERTLSYINRKYYLNTDNQNKAKDILGICDSDFIKSLSYATDRYVFEYYSRLFNTMVLLAFIILAGFSYVEDIAGLYFSGPISKSLAVFFIIGCLSFIVSLPFDYYNTFVIEEKHGFNTQTKKGFIVDTIKSILVNIVLLGLILTVVLSIMQYTGPYWWVWAWVAVTGISIITTWLYPVILAPIFNKFTPLQDGNLKDKILELAKKIDFPTDGIYVMDASKRSNHGNAYFTGIFKKKRIVLFDTLLKSLTDEEIVAVLSHELGHFKLHHVRNNLIKSFIISVVTFYLLSLTINFESFYYAFGFKEISLYASLIVFGLWFSIISFMMIPFTNYFSRKDEFAADRFAVNLDRTDKNLRSALLKLRETNKMLPLTAPAYSFFYYSHPPLLERIEAMGKVKIEE